MQGNRLRVVPDFGERQTSSKMGAHRRDTRVLIFPPDTCVSLTFLFFAEVRDLSAVYFEN